MSVDFSSLSYGPEQNYPAGQQIQPIAQTDNDFDDDHEGSCLRPIIVFVVFLIIIVAVWFFFFTKKNNDVEKSPVTSHSENIIGPAGGEVRHSSGAKIIIPAGALDRELLIRIEKVAEGRVTDLYRFLPDGLQFIRPVKVIIPYKESNLNDRETPYDIALWSGDQQNKLDEKKQTVVLLGEKKVSAEITRL